MTDEPMLESAPPRKSSNDKRPWYLTLRPDKQRLRQLCQRVAEQLIPELRMLGDRLAAEDLEGLGDLELADCLQSRQALVERWKRIYWELGIPCVNGVPNAVDLLQDGDRVTVDGYLGIVTVGTSEFSLEHGLREDDS